MTRLVLVLFCLGIVLAGPSCTKQIEQTIYLDTVISGNDAPPYDGITTLQLRLYINRIYIDLLGREATDSEMQQALALLANDPKTPARRDSVVAPLTRTTEYFNRLYELTSQDFINGVDSAEITSLIIIINYLWHVDSLAGNLQNYIYYQADVRELQDLLAAATAYRQGSITVHEFFRRFLMNFYYDEINMGSENFVKAAFDDLFLRHPSEAELAAGITMVDNGPAVLFGQNGNSKGDFADIVVHSDAFLEGLIRKAYLQLLQREPTTAEIAQDLPLLLQTGNWQLLKRKLMISEEYAGF